MVRLCDGPAADVLGLSVFDEGHHDLIHEGLVAGEQGVPHGEHEGEHGDPDADGQAGRSPPQLLSNDVAFQRPHSGAAQLFGEASRVVALLVGCAEDVPKGRLRRDHLLRRQLVELEGRRAHDLCDEAVRFFPKRRRLRRYVLVQFQVHLDPPLVCGGDKQRRWMRHSA